MAENEKTIIESVENTQTIYGPPSGENYTKITNEVVESQPIYGPAPENTTGSGETTGTTQDTTTETNIPTMSNTTDTSSTETTSETSTIADAETTSPSTRTSVEHQMKIESDGTMTIDGKVATNEQLEEYFDYTKYSDQQSAKMVEGLLKSDTVTINGVAYKAELNQNGEMESKDGTSRLTQEEIKGYFGDKGYEALVCKTTKNVTVDENGKIKIEDREEQVKLNIAEPVVNTNTSNSANTSNQAQQEQAKEKSDTDQITSPSSGGHSGGSSSGGGYSGGGGGYSGGSSSGGSLSSGGADSPNEEEVEDPGTPIIMVEFGQLEAIRDELQTLKGQLTGVTDDYGSTINGLSGNSSAWSGADKDKYVSQKKGYVTNIGQVSSTLDAFVGYLDTCVNNYKELEAKLAAKQIS